MNSRVLRASGGGGGSLGKNRRTLKIAQPIMRGIGCGVEIKVHVIISKNVCEKHIDTARVKRYTMKRDVYREKRRVR